MVACGIRERATNDADERETLKVVEMGVDGEKGLGVAGSKAVGHFREGEAMAEKAVLQLSVVEGVEDVEDG